MSTDRPRINRGPAAAAENRRALIEAARHLFAERGYEVPLHAVAKKAGVGQGVLYRHFPRRIDLALAAFEDNMTRLEADFAVVSEGSLLRLWWRIVDTVIASSAFVNMAVQARHEVATRTPVDRLRALIARHLPHARIAGEVRPDLEVEDVQAAIRMVYGLVVTSDSEASLRRVIEHLTRTWMGP